MNACVCLDMSADDMRAAEAAGAIEFWDWRPRNLDELRALSEAKQLPIVIFSGNTFEEPLVDDAAHRQALAHVARSIEAARLLNTRILVAHVGYAIGGRPKEAQWEAALTGLRAAGRLAAGAGITLAVEPLNSTLDHPGYFLDTLPAALRLIDEVNLPSVRLLLDVYHMRMMHDDLVDRLPEAIPYAVHVHVADVPGRREPGTGTIDWRLIMRALRRANYHGYVGLECWPSGEPAAAVRRAIEVLTS